MKHNVMIDLDALLDTKLGVLYEHCPELADELLLSGKWQNRTSDDIEDITDKITNEQFKEWFNNRSLKTLEYSRITSFIFELQSITNELLYSIYSDATRIKEASIIVNCAPFNDLIQDDLIHIQLAIQEYIGKDITVLMTNIPREKVTLPYLKRNHILTYVGHSIRDFFHGLVNENTPAENIIPHPKLTAILPKRIPDKEVLEFIDSEIKNQFGNSDIFEIMRIYWAPLIGLSFCPPQLMALIDPDIIESGD